MRWFKHMTDASEDETMSLLLDEFGAAGYGTYWIVLEKIAKKIDASSITKLKYSKQKWINFCSISPKKFTDIVKFLSNSENFRTKRPAFYIRIEGKYIEIDCPKLLKYRDEYTEKRARRSEKSRDTIGTNSVKNPPRTDTDTDTDTDTEREREKERARGIIQKFSDTWDKNLEEHRKQFPGLQFADLKENLILHLKSHPDKQPKGDMSSWILRQLKREKPLRVSGKSSDPYGDRNLTFEEFVELGVKNRKLNDPNGRNPGYLDHLKGLYEKDAWGMSVGRGGGKLL